jgi:hypothetical protein
MVQLLVAARKVRAPLLVIVQEAVSLDVNVTVAPHDAGVTVAVRIGAVP